MGSKVRRIPGQAIVRIARRPGMTKVRRVTAGPGSSGPGGTFDGEHAELDGREDPNQHPATAVSIDATEVNTAGGEAWPEWSPSESADLDSLAKHVAESWPAGGGGPLRVLDAPSDNETITAATATDGKLDYDVVRVLDAETPGERGFITLPHPSEWPDQTVTVVGDAFGPSIGYWDPDGLASTDHLTVSVTPAAVVNNLGALGDDNLTGGATLTTEDFDGDFTDAVVWGFTGSDPISGVVVRDVVVTGGSDVAIFGVLLDATTFATLGASPIESGDNTLTLDTPTAASDVVVALSVAPAGGSPVPPTSIAFAGIDVPALGRYRGYDNDARGLGELVDPPAGTHAWFDRVGKPGKSLRLFSDGDKLYVERVPLRWEFLEGFVEETGGPIDGLHDASEAFALLNEAVKELEDAPGGGTSPAPPRVTGAWAWAASTHGGVYSTNQVLSGGMVERIWLMPFLPDMECVITGIRAYVHNTPTAGCVYRFGAYEMAEGVVASIDALVGALLDDAGTVAADSTGWSSITGLSIPCPASGVFLGFCAQSVGATGPAVTVMSTATNPAAAGRGAFVPRDGNPAFSGVLTIHSESGISGAFPSTVTADAADHSGYTSIAPMLQVQVSA